MGRTEEKLFSVKYLHYFYLLSFVLLLSACQPPATKPVEPTVNGAAPDFLQQQLSRELNLSQQNAWAFRGRVAISDGQQAGTVNMRWKQRGENFDIEISVPITRQTWQLRSAGPRRVQLLAYGLTVMEGDSAEAVVKQATGWQIPFADLQAWVRGMRAQGVAQAAFAPSGLPASFKQNGWFVDYREWNQSVLPMPTKVFANTNSNGKNASVRLQIESWELP
jgi:outer membrane lipoprotein LolB